MTVSTPLSIFNLLLLWLVLLFYVFGFKYLLSPFCSNKNQTSNVDAEKETISDGDAGGGGLPTKIRSAYSPVDDDDELQQRDIFNNQTKTDFVVAKDNYAQKVVLGTFFLMVLLWIFR